MKTRLVQTCFLEPSFHSAAVLLLLTPTLAADPGATLIVPSPEAWTGQRLPFVIELRAEGSFKGAPTFDLPEIPQSVIIKIGSPVLSSETEGDTEYFVQRHEFALFSQASGELQLPPVTARFSHLKGYSGPAFDASVKTEARTLTLSRPPNSESLGFLVTTEDLEIKETWDPSPGPLETGAVLKRTIVQRASQMTGIALKPAPSPEIEGIRTYTGTPSVSDKTHRGAFLGERNETITYLVQEAGFHTLPEIRYDWWDPIAQKLESKTLPAVTFTATAPPPPPAKPSPLRFLPWIAAGLFMVAAFYVRDIIKDLLRRLRDRINPPEARAKRAFIKACRLNDPQAAASRWIDVQHSINPSASDPALQSELTRLYRCLYGASPNPSQWKGDQLAASFKHSIESPASKTKHRCLPDLNP